MMAQHVATPRDTPSTDPSFPVSHTRNFNYLVAQTVHLRRVYAVIACGWVKSGRDPLVSSVRMLCQLLKPAARASLEG